MPDRSISIALEAKVAGFVNGMSTAKRSASSFMDELDKSAAKSRALNDLGRTAGKVGLAAGAGLALVTKAAMDWESAWAGVTKTVNGSASEMAVLEEQLRQLARTLPASHEEIAGVAEAAGQLGIERENVAKFTETMIALGETTNLAANEAATALARVSNIMGTPQAEIERMGSTIVDLGNNSATTEAEIVTLGTRLAAAGKQAGLTESDIFAIASTLTSVGVEAEAGGTAMSKVFTSIGDAVRDGGENLETFAKVAGVTVDEFQKAFAEDGAAAIGMFVEGMGRLSAEGESTSAVFKSLGLTDQRLSRAILSAGSATGLWADQLDLASNAWDQNTALSAEAAQRYATSASQMQVALNNIKDAAIEFGEVALPIVAQVATGVSGLAKTFGGLPGPVKTATTSLLGITAVTGGGLWFGSKVIAGVVDTRRAINDLGVTAPRTARALKGLGTAAIGLAVLEGLDTIIDNIERSMRDALPATEAMTGMLLDISSGKLDGLGGQFKSLGDDLDFFASEEPSSKWVDWIPNITGLLPGENAIERVHRIRDELEALDDSISDIATTGSAEQAKDALQAFADAQGLTAAQTEKLSSRLPQYNEALAAQANASTLAAESTQTAGEKQAAFAALLGQSEHALGPYADGLGQIADAADDGADKVNHFKSALASLSGFLDKQGALDSYQAAIDDLTKSVKENGRTWDSNTEKGRANRAQLRQVAQATADYAQTLKGTDRQKFLSAAIADLKAQAKQLGIAPRLVQPLINKLKEADKTDVNPTIKADTGPAIANLNALSRAADAATRARVINISVNRPTNLTGPGLQRASGGEIHGPGTKTSDSVPVMASRGEFMMKAAAVDKYGVGFMHKVNSLHLAGGGSVGGGSSMMRSGDSTTERIERETKRGNEDRRKGIKKQATQLEKILAASQDLQSTVSANFKTDPFSNNYTLQGVLASLSADTKGAGDFSQAAKNAKRLGLDGKVFQALLESGNTAVLEDLNSRGDVRKLEQAWRQRNKATADLTFGAATRGRWEGDSLKELTRELHHLRAQIKHMGRNVEKGAERGTHRGTKDNRRRRQTAMSRADLP